MDPSAPAEVALAAMQVISDPMLFPITSSFQRGIPLWTVYHEHSLAHNPANGSQNDMAKATMDTAGLLPRLAIQLYDLDTLVKLHELSKQPYASEHANFSFSTAMDDAAKCGNFEALQWLHDNTDETCQPSTICSVAMNGHANVMLWLLANLPESHHEITSALMDSAASNGHLEIVQVLHEWSTEGCTTQAMDGAAMNGHLDLVVFLHANRMEGCTTDAVDTAAENGHLHVLEWLLLLREEGFTETASYGAVTNGYHEVVQCLWESRFSFSEDVLRAGIRRAVPVALNSGDIGMVSFLHDLISESFPIDSIVLAESAGHHDLAEYLRQVRYFREGADAALLIAAHEHAIASANTLLDSESFALELLQEALEETAKKPVDESVEVGQEMLALQIRLCQLADQNAPLDRGASSFR